MAYIPRFPSRPPHGPVGIGDDDVLPILASVMAGLVFVAIVIALIHFNIIQ